MVALIPHSEIQALNIDTVERAIIFAALSLRAAIVGRTEFDPNQDRDVLIDIVTNRDNTTSLSIDVLLTFDSYSFYSQGGSIIENIQTLPNALFSLNNQFNLTVQPSVEPLPEIPDFNRVIVNTFERYLFYYSSILWASLENKRNKIVSFKFNSDSTIKLDLAIPFDINKWLLGDNYINSVLRVTDNYLVPATSNILSLLNNNQILNNDLFLTN